MQSTSIGCETIQVDDLTEISRGNGENYKLKAKVLCFCGEVGSWKLRKFADSTIATHASPPEGAQLFAHA
jgi:hypothetical protein